MLGGYDWTGALLFERFLIFILLMSIVFLSLNNIDMFKEKKAVLWTVAIIVPLLSIRFIDFIWLNTILMQYQVLGIALAGILPFIIYLFFLHGVSDHAVVRKIGWIFFIVIYFGLWVTSEAESYGSVYFWTMLIALVFLLMDGTIHRAFDRQRWREADRSQVVAALTEIGHELNRLDESKGIPEPVLRKERRKLMKRREYLQKQL